MKNTEQPYIAERKGNASHILRTGSTGRVGRPKLPPGLAEMVEIARLFYEDDLTRQQISKRLDMDPRKVTWLLQQAKELGVVKITINDPVNGPISIGTCNRPQAPQQMMLPLKPIF